MEWNGMKTDKKARESVMSNIYKVRGFEQEIRNDAAKIIGRTNELSLIREKISDIKKRVFWLTGPAGVGKTFLLSSITAELMDNTSENTLVLPYRFIFGDERCSQNSFLCFAIKRLKAWKQSLQKIPSIPEPLDELKEILSRIIRLNRVLFIIDGLEQIADCSGTFIDDISLKLTYSGVTWICAGRPEKNLSEVFTPKRCCYLFPDGVPAMNAGDIRTMLSEKIDPLHMHLLEQDRKEGQLIEKPLIESITEHAHGCPMYVVYVIQEIISNNFFNALDNGRKLPLSLKAYNEELLHRCIEKTHDQKLTVSMLATFIVAKEPLTARVLVSLLKQRGIVPKGKPGLQLIYQGLSDIASILKCSITSKGEKSYSLFHHFLYQYIVEYRILHNDIKKAKQAFCQAVLEERADDASTYFIRHGINHLFDETSYDNTLKTLTAFNGDMSPLMISAEYNHVQVGVSVEKTVSNDWHLLLKAEFEVNKGEVKGLLELKGNRILLWSKSGCFQIFNILTGKCLYSIQLKIEGSPFKPEYVLVLKDGRIIAWSNSNICLECCLLDDQTLHCIDTAKVNYYSANDFDYPAIYGMWDAGNGNVIMLPYSNGSISADSSFRKDVIPIKLGDITLTEFTDQSVSFVQVNDSLAAVYHLNGKISLVDMQTKQYVCELEVLHSEKSPFEYDHGHKIISNGNFLCWENNILYVCDISTGKIKNSMSLHRYFIINAFQISEDYIISASHHSCCLWNLKSDSVVEKPAPVQIAKIYPLSETMVIIQTGSNISGNLLVWNFHADDKKISWIKFGCSNSLSGVLSLNDKSIVTWSDGNKLQVWKGEMITNLKPLQAKASEVYNYLTMGNGRVLIWGDWIDFVIQDISCDNQLRKISKHIVPLKNVKYWRPYILNWETLCCSFAIRNIEKISDSKVIIFAENSCIKILNITNGKCQLIHNTANADLKMLLSNGLLLVINQETLTKEVQGDMMTSLEMESWMSKRHWNSRQKRTYNLSIIDPETTRTLASGNGFYKKNIKWLWQKS